MSNKLKELHDKRLKAHNEARALLDKANTESRSLNTEEKAAYDKAFKEVMDLKDVIDRAKQLDDAERDFVTGQNEEDRSRSGKAKDGEHTGPTATPEYRSAFQSYLSTGEVDKRTLIQGNGPQAGWLVPIQQVDNTLVKFIDNAVLIRQKATVIKLKQAQSLGIISYDTDVNDADWVTEQTTGTEDTAAAFGKRELRPNPLAKFTKISNTLLRNATVLPIDTFILERLAYKFAVTEEKHYIAGNGSGQPLGVMTASPQGISTARDVATDNGTTAPTFDGLKNAKFALKPQYWPQARWMFHRDGVKLIDKLKGGDGQYIWQPSVVAGGNDTLLGFPVDMSEYMSNTFTTGQYAGILACWKFYYIADALDMTIQRLNELYARTNETGFIGRKEVDGMPVLEEAFVRVKLG